MHGKHHKWCNNIYTLLVQQCSLFAFLLPLLPGSCLLWASRLALFSSRTPKISILIIAKQAPVHSRIGCFLLPPCRNRGAAVLFLYTFLKRHCHPTWQSALLASNNGNTEHKHLLHCLSARAYWASNGIVSNVVGRDGLFPFRRAAFEVINYGKMELKGAHTVHTRTHTNAKRTCEIEFYTCRRWATYTVRGVCVRM